MRRPGRPSTPPSAAPVGISGAAGSAGAATAGGGAPPEPTLEQPARPNGPSARITRSVRCIVPLSPRIALTGSAASRSPASLRAGFRRVPASRRRSRRDRRRSRDRGRSRAANSSSRFPRSIAAARAFLSRPGPSSSIWAIRKGAGSWSSPAARSARIETRSRAHLPALSRRLPMRSVRSCASPRNLRSGCNSTSNVKARSPCSFS